MHAYTHKTELLYGYSYNEKSKTSCHNNHSVMLHATALHKQVNTYKLFIHVKTTTTTKMMIKTTTTTTTRETA